MDNLKILEMIMNKQITVRKASEQYNISRDKLTKLLKETYGTEKVEAVLKENKKNPTKMSENESELRNIYLQILSGKMTLKEAKKQLNIADKETIRVALFEFIKENGSANDIEEYGKFRDKIDRDYSGINFRTVAINMIEFNVSQSEIANAMGLSPRTISREFEKLKNDKDQSLYKLIKVYSHDKMIHHDFDSGERQIQSRIIKNYVVNNPDLMVLPQESNTEKRVRQENEMYIKYQEMKDNNYTTKQIAEKLGISVSGIRRMLIRKQNRELLVSNKTSNVSSKKEVVKKLDQDDGGIELE